METVLTEQLKPIAEVDPVSKVNPARIMQTGMGFWSSKILLTAVNLRLFTILDDNELSGNEIRKRTGIHERSLYDFLDSLVALGFLRRRGIRETALYSNAEETGTFLNRNKYNYVGGILEMANNRLFGFWNGLEEGLKTGLPQNETKNGGKPVFEAIYAEKEKLEEFLNAMGGLQMGNFINFSRNFDFSKYETLCDIGGAGGHLVAQVAIENPHMQCINFDLPPVASRAKENIARIGLNDRVKVLAGDFFRDEFPKADIITMGNILHDWGLEDKKMLMKKAFDALPAGGALVVIENIIDDNRCENAFGLMLSLNMLLETPEGFDFSKKDFDVWAEETGFTETYLMPLEGPSSAIVALK